MKRSLMLAATLLAATQLSACDRLSAAVDAFNAPPIKAPAAPVDATPLPTSNPPLTPTNKGLPAKAMPDQALQDLASVIEVTPLTAQKNLSGKLFGVGGGDPAMNGLHTYLAFFRSPAEGSVGPRQRVIDDEGTRPQRACNWIQHGLISPGTD